MADTYHGILDGDRVQWIGPCPPFGPIDVVAPTASESETLPVETSEERAERGRRMAEALERLAEINAFASIEDPAAWQREIRKDRQLPGRD